MVRMGHVILGMCESDTVRDGSMHATGQCTLTPPKHSNPSMSTRDNSINISLIKAALAAIESLELGEKLCYIKIAQEYRVNRSTLSRRHRG
jgi:hypothetical protein